MAWIDELLAAGFEPRRGERTRAMFSWAIPLQQEFPTEFAAIRAALTDPLEAVLAAGLADGTFPTTDPARDATLHPRPHLGARRRSPLRSGVGCRRGRGPGGRAPLRPPGPRSFVTSTGAYFDEAAETRSRSELDAMQLERLLLMLPHAYEHSPLVRSVWEEAGVHPRDIRSLADFAERAPFTDKETLRHWREDRGDPYAGLLCVPGRRSDHDPVVVGYHR